MRAIDIFRSLGSLIVGRIGGTVDLEGSMLHRNKTTSFRLISHICIYHKRIRENMPHTKV